MFTLLGLFSKKINGKTAKEWFDEGHALASLKRYEEAIGCYDNAIEVDPKDAIAWHGKGYAFARLKRYEDAIRSYDKSIGINSGFGADVVWNDKGLLFFELKKYEEAIRCYDKALEVNPWYIAALVNKGYAFTGLNRYEEAIKCDDKAIKLKPENFDAWILKGNALAGLKKYEEAIKCYDKAIEINPEDSNAWNNKGLTLAELKRYEDAIKCYDGAIGITPENATVWNNKGLTLAELKRYEDAIRCYDKAIDLIPEFDDAQKNKESAEEKLREPLQFKIPEQLASKPVSPQEFIPSSLTPKTFPPELQPKYTDVEFLGKGGFARVFKAKRKSDGKVVAVKIPISLDEATGKSFLKEIKAWEELKHPNIVELYDMNIMPLPYFEMEYVDNRSIEELKKPIEVERAARIVFDISEGLKYAHSRRIIHRDLKPHNVLLTKDLIPKITDWGLSKVLAESKTSSVAGFSPVYAAPEQVSPKQFGRADARTDIYQLGTIFYELVAGRLPFGGDSVAEISSAIINEKPAPPSTLNPEARDVEDIILKCLAKNQGERYQSVQELQKALAEHLKIEYKESLKESTRKKDITKSRLFCGDLVLISAKIGDYTEVLKYLSILKDYAKPEETTDIENLINELDYRLKEGIEPGDDFSEKIKILAYRVQMK